MSDIFDQIDVTKNPDIDEDIKQRYVDQAPGAPDGFEQPAYFTEIADRMIAEGGDPEETIARLNAAHFLSRQQGISLEEAYDNYDAVSEEYFGRATPPASTVEAIANTYKAAEIGTKVAELAYQLMERGGEDPELQKRMEELYAQMPPEDTIKRSLGTKALKAAAQFIPSQARSFSAGAWEGLAVAGAGAALASPSAATGLGALSIPTIATLGFTVGSAHGSVEKARQLEAGALYADLLRYQDPITGERINPQVAATAAKVYGGMAAVVELFQAEAFFKKFPGLRQAAMDAIVDKSAKAARAGVVQRQLFKLAGEASSTAKDTAADILGNTAEETLQEILNIGAEEFAKQVTDLVDGTALTPATRKEVQDRIVETMVGTAIGMGVLSGIPSGARLLVGGAQAGAGAAKVAAVAAEEEKGAPGASATEGDLALFKKKAAEAVPADAHIQAKEEIEGELYTLKMGSKTADEATGKGKRYGFVRYSVDQDTESVTIEGFGRDAEPAVNLALAKNLMARYPGWEINFDPKTPMQAAMKDYLTAENPRGSGLQWYATPAMKNRTMTYDYIRERIQEQKPGWAKDEVEFSVRFLDTLARPMGMSGEELADATFAPGIFGNEGARIAAQGATGSTSIIHLGEEIRTVINLAKDANPSTWMHEAVHAATLFAVENRGKNEKIESFVGQLEGLLGVQGGDWYADVQGWAAEYKGAKNAHEALAYAIEDYFLTGEVPDPKVRGLFHRIAKWLVDLYKTITAERYKVSPELKAYMDRLFATPESPLYELATTMGEDDVKSPAGAQPRAASKPEEETQGITSEEPRTQQRPDIEEPEIYQKRDVMERSARDSLKEAQAGREGTGWNRSKWDGEWRYSQPEEGASAEQVVQEQARRGDVPAVDGMVPSLFRKDELFQGRAEGVESAVDEIAKTLEEEGISYTVKPSRASLSRYIEAEVAGATRWIRVSDHPQGPRSRMRGTVGFDAVIGEAWAPAFLSWLGKLLDKEILAYEDRPREMKTTERGIATTELFQIKDLNHGAKAGFEAFDHTFMGSGEGQQVYGWGSYLTENRGVARDNYAKRLGEEFELLFNVDQPQPGSFNSKTRDPGYRRIFEAMKKEITAAGPGVSLSDQAGIKRIIDKAIDAALREAEYEDDTTGNGVLQSVKMAADRMRDLIDFDRPLQIRKGRWLYTVDVETKGKRKAKPGTPAGPGWNHEIRDSDIAKIKEKTKNWDDWTREDFDEELGQVAAEAFDFFASELGEEGGTALLGFIKNLGDAILFEELDYPWTGDGLASYLGEQMLNSNQAAGVAFLKWAGITDIYPEEEGSGKIMLDAGSLARGEADLYSHIGDGAMDPAELVDFAESFYDDESRVPSQWALKIVLTMVKDAVATSLLKPPSVPADDIRAWLEVDGIYDPENMPESVKAHSKGVTLIVTSLLQEILNADALDSRASYKTAAQLLLDYWGGPDGEPYLFLVPNKNTPTETLEQDGRWLRWDKPMPEEDWKDVFEVIGQLRDAVAEQTQRVEYVLKEENRYNVANFTDRQLFGGYPTEKKALENAKAIADKTGKDVRVVDGLSEEGREFWDPENERFYKGDFFTLSSDYFEKRIVEDEKFSEVVGKIFGDNSYDMELTEDFSGKMDELEMALPQFENWEENTGTKPTGEDLYNVLKETLGMKYASLLLSGAGFDGVTYPVAFLTGGSGDKGMNYVVFDDKAIKIAKRVLFQPAHADGSRSSQEGNLDDPVLASIKDIASQFATWQEFAEDMEIPFNDELRALAGADKLDDDARNRLYKEIWEATSRTASFGSDIDLWVKSLEANNGQGVVEFLETIWDEILSGAMFDYQPLDEEEAEIITKRRERADRVRSEIAEVVKAAAIRLGAKGKRPSDRMIASILGVIRKNPEEYARIYAEVYDVPELLEAAQAAVEQKYADIEDPKFKAERLSISQKAAMAKILENEELGRAIMRGDVVVEKDVLEYIKGLQAEAKAQTEQADKLKDEIREDNKMLSRWEKRWLEASTKIGQMDDEIKKIDGRIQTLAKDNKRIPQSLIDEGNSLKRIRETMIRQRDRAQREVENPAKLQTRLAKIEEAARIKLSAKARDMKIRAARDLRAYQRKLARQIMKPASDQIAIQQQRAIRNIQAMIDPKRRSDRTQEQIEALRKELEKNPALASEIPREWLNRATKKNLSEMSLKELEEIAEVVKGLRSEGRAVFKRKEDARKEADRATQDHIADLLIHLPGAAAPGEKPDPNSWIGRFVSKLREADYSFTNAQRFARMMDGSSEGPNYDLLILERDRQYRKEMTEVDRRTKRIMDAFDREGVSPESWYDTEVTIRGAGPGRRDKIVRKSDLAALELAFRNEDSRAAALFGNFFSHYEKRTMNEEELYFEGDSRFQAIRAAIDSALTDRDLRVLETFAADGDETGERLVETVGEVENRNMETVDNYFPINREGVTGDPIDVQIAGDVLNRTPGLKRPPKNGFTKSRVNISPKHQTPIKLDLLTTWMHSIQATEHYIANAAYGKRLNGVYLNNFMQEALRSAMGDEGVAYLKDYIAEVKNPGELRNVSRWENSIKWLRGNLGAAYLGFRASSVLKQFITSPWPALAYAGPRLLGEAFHCLANPVRFVRETEAMSIVLKHRTADLVMDAVKRANATSPTGRKIQKVNQLGMLGLEMADRVSVAIGWRAIYEKELAAHGDIQKAIEKADDITLKTQPSSRGVDLAPIYRNGGEGVRLLLQFTSAMNVIWQNIRHDLPSAFREKNYLQGVGIITSYVIAGTLLNLATEGDEDDEDRGKLLAFYAITQGTESIPLIGQDVTRLARQVITGDAGYDFPDTALPGAAQVFDGLTTIAKDPDNWAKGLKQFSAGVGIIAGAPVSGVKEGARVLTGDFGALVGKPRSE